MDCVREESTYILDLEFRNLAGLPVVPYDVTYTVFDVLTGEELRNATEINTGGSAHALELLPSDTALIDPTHREEYRGVLVRFKHGQGQQSSGEHRFVVVRAGGGA